MKVHIIYGQKEIVMFVFLVKYVVEDVLINIIILVLIVQKVIIYGQQQIKAQYVIIIVQQEIIHFQEIQIFQEIQENISQHQQADFVMFVTVYALIV